jgi:quercetin dioxygenase-like cupin family protein
MDDALALLRLVADPGGAWAERAFAPPAAPFAVTEPVPATSWVAIRLPVGWDGRQHPSPRRQALLCLEGALEVTSSAGETRALAAGAVLLMEDTHGRGHRTVVVAGPFVGVLVALPEAEDAP